MKAQTSKLQEYFSPFRENIIGIDASIDTPYSQNIPILYADWTASGRNYKPIEQLLIEKFMPLVANTHTETNSTGMAMTHSYKAARQIIKNHVNASDDDVLISCGSGMTGVINKFQRILGLRVHEKYKVDIDNHTMDKPVIFVTHMEHHSNQTSWLECIADVVVVNPDEAGLVCLERFEKALAQYEDRAIKIAAITSCSNVTGIMTNYHQVAAIMHRHGGLCFVDFACSAPYVDINMHPKNEDEKLDAIYYSPHKFLGGPGSTGILVFHKELYQNQVPDHPGGGTVDFTNPWGQHKFVDNIEEREDGGTPAFLQTIKTALCIKLKEQMGVSNILHREEELLEQIWNKLEGVEGLHILAGEHKDRLGVISFYIDGLHYNVGVKMLNDKFGIQTRGGCSCAGTYGHYLLNVDTTVSNEITSKIALGDCSLKPGWIRMSIHPTMTDEELTKILDGVEALARNFKVWESDYDIDHSRGLLKHHSETEQDAIKQRMNSYLESTLV